MVNLRNKSPHISRQSNVAVNVSPSSSRPLLSTTLTTT